MIYCTRSRFSATHANTVGKLYANFQANAKPLQGMQLLGCRCFVRFFERPFKGVRGTGKCDLGSLSWLPAALLQAIKKALMIKAFL
jgi:hypothetical protein